MRRRDNANLDRAESIYCDISARMSQHSSICLFYIRVSATLRRNLEDKDSQMLSSFSDYEKISNLPISFQDKHDTSLFDIYSLFSRPFTHGTCCVSDN
jgi:hypothetical protein